ncbi:plasma membrane H+-ATPase [Blyttiomyces sp. JEL0837]|nr:plasma membrane H+-ATPase [Blyttiomyces sp. JEL0837]
MSAPRRVTSNAPVPSSNQPPISAAMFPQLEMMDLGGSSGTSTGRVTGTHGTDPAPPILPSSTSPNEPIPENRQPQIQHAYSSTGQVTTPAFHSPMKDVNGDTVDIEATNININKQEDTTTNEESINHLLQELLQESQQQSKTTGTATAIEIPSSTEEEVTGKSGIKPQQEIPNSLLQTDPRYGLTTEEVGIRRKKYGLNQLAEHHENLILKFMLFFSGPIQYVMIAAAALAGGLQDWAFFKNTKPANIVAQLKSQLALKTHVVRDNGHLIEIDDVDLVPGDIVKLDEGVIVPADGKLLEFVNIGESRSVGDTDKTEGVGGAGNNTAESKQVYLQVDQSALTGESLVVEKYGGVDILYSSSAVKRGSGYMLVTAIGDSTYVGRTASLTESTTTRGKFTEVLKSIGVILLVLVVFWILIIWIAGFYRGLGITVLLEYALIITVIGVPVGLPAVVTTTLAVGAADLAKKKAIVQKLSAIESLAGVEILCTDKTGTLTKNKLVLHEPFLIEGVDADTLFLVAALASSRKKKGLDAIDKTVMLALLNHPRARSEIDNISTIKFQPFDPITKRVVSVVRFPDGMEVTCVKGAPSAVLKLIKEGDGDAEHQGDGGGDIVDEDAIERDVDSRQVKLYNDKVAEFAKRGFRSLGVAWKRSFPGEVKKKWQILGILCLFDPPRDDTLLTVREAKQLGLRIKMLTGDAVGIAKETARQLEFGSNVYNTKMLVNGSPDFPGSELYDFVVAADGFAEVFPEHKYMVVDMLQKRGFLVAMTGDGVNDAPSLKKADTGIAVEGSSDAARSAADIVVLTPGFSPIIHAIKTSRQIFHRMYSYVVYRIALSLHLEIFLTTSLVILNRTINVELVVFLAIFADIATLAIAFDNAPYSHTPVKWNLPEIWGILFLQVTLTENWLIFVTRSNTSLWDTLPSWQLICAVLTVDLFATLFCLFGWFIRPRVPGQSRETDIVTVVRVWIYSFGCFALIAMVYYGMANSEFFTRLLCGKIHSRRRKSLEDFLVKLDRVSRMHERGNDMRYRSRRRRSRTNEADPEDSDDEPFLSAGEQEPNMRHQSHHGGRSSRRRTHDDEDSF